MNSCPTESTCVGTQTTSACKCNLGYGPAWVSGGSGSCETYACTGYCLNSGTCSINGTSGAAECGCPAGYSGDQCEVSVCDDKNCNSGSCEVKNDGKPRCVCDAGFSGMSCEISPTTVATTEAETTTESAGFVVGISLMLVFFVSFIM